MQERARAKDTRWMLYRKRERVEKGNKDGGKTIGKKREERREEIK